MSRLWNPKQCWEICDLMPERGGSKNDECENLQPEYQTADHDHAGISPRSGNLSGFLPVHPERHTDVRSRGVPFPVALAIRPDGQQPKHGNHQRNDDKGETHRAFLSHTVRASSLAACFRNPLAFCEKSDRMSAMSALRPLAT